MARRKTTTATASETSDVNQQEAETMEQDTAPDFSADIPADDDETDEGYIPSDDEASETGDTGADDEASETGDKEPAEELPGMVTEFIVTLNSVHGTKAAELGERVDITVKRAGGKSYTAVYVPGGDEEPTTSKVGCATAKTAINSLITAMGQSTRDFVFDASKFEPAKPTNKTGSNQPDTFFFDDPERPETKQLEEIAVTVDAADEKLIRAGSDTRSGWVMFGRARNAMLAVFHSAGYDDETNDRSRAAWGKYLRSRFAGRPQVEEILGKKNRAGQAGLFGSAPDELIDLIDVNTASTFERKRNEAVQTFAETIAKELLAGADDENDKFSAADIFLSCNERLSTMADRIAKVRQDRLALENKNKPVPPLKTVKIGTVPFIPYTQLHGMMDWVLPDDLTTFETSILYKKILEETEKLRTAPTNEEKATQDIEKSAKKIAELFKDKSVPEAAQHLLSILISHPEADAVLETLAEKLSAWQEAQEQKAIDEAAKSEKEEV